MATIKFVHITDTHLLNRSEEMFHGLNTKESLEMVLSNSQIRYPDIDFFYLPAIFHKQERKQVTHCLNQ